MNFEDRVRGYAREVVGDWEPDRTAVARFDAGNRHAVFRVSSDDEASTATGVVVRISTSDDVAEREQAELEALVLATLQGTGAPRLHDFRVQSTWFDTPVMCIELVEGEQRDLASVPTGDLERLGSVVASVHNLAVDDLAGRMRSATTLTAYVDERLALNEAYVPRLREPLPASVQGRVDRAFTSVAASVERMRHAESFGHDRLVLLHGDVASGNILWADEPVLIDWEYARLGDPADEVAYVFGQHGFTARQRTAFWAGYRRASAHPRVDHLEDRVRWWEPVLLLGSVLWWLERWSRRVDADVAGIFDSSVTREASYYLEHATVRLDHFDAAVSQREFG